MNNLYIMAAVGLTTSLAMGDSIVPVDQTRYLEGYADFWDFDYGSDEDYGYVEAPDFDPFLESLTVTAGWGVVAEATATQDSYILAEGIIASGTAFGNAMFCNDTIFHGEAESYLNVVFDLTSPVDISLTGTLWSNPQLGSAIASLSLYEGGVPILDFEANASEWQTELIEMNELISLQAGTYTLTAGAYAMGSSDGDYYESESSFDFNMSVIPAPATLLPIAMGLAATRKKRRRTT